LICGRAGTTWRTTSVPTRSAALIAFSVTSKSIESWPKTT